MLIRKLLMRSAWYIKGFGGWVYFLGLGHCDYSSPSYCEHCGKWNFEEKETKDEDG